MVKTWLLGVVFAMASVLSGRVLAQIQPASTLAWVDGWSLTPLVDPGQGSLVTSILALRNPAELTGQNITAVWYVRDTQDSSQWTAKAWSGVSEWEAVKWVKDAIAVPDCFDDVWATFTPKIVVHTASIPEDYYKGFVATDPLLEVIEESPDRDSLVAVLSAVGYKVADIPLDFKGGLSADDDRTNLMLSAIDSGVEAQENTNPTGSNVFGSVFQAEFQSSFSLAWFCYPISYTAPGTWSAWSTGAWALAPCTGTGFCCYNMQVCRTRTVVQYTVTVSCAVGVSDTWQEQECWTHSGSCPALAQGACPAAPTCNLAVPQTPGNTPPPGVCPIRQRN